MSDIGDDGRYFYQSLRLPATLAAMESECAFARTQSGGSPVRAFSSPQLIGMAERVRVLLAELEAARKGQGRWVG